jgi:Lysyl oxidase
MRRPARAIRCLSALALATLVAIGSSMTGPMPAAAIEGDKRPNLQMLPLRDWRVQTVNGRRLLRFTSIFVNAGSGHFEVRGKRSSASDPTMNIQQRMFRWDGSSRMITTRAEARYAADGHDHWHVQGVTVYEAWKESDPDTIRRGAKTGICFLDSEPWNLSIRGARRAPYYRGHGCGTRGSVNIHAGLSVGWADNYPWSFAFQWIDITGLPGGTYMVRTTVDIQNHYDESVETDNCVWARIRIPHPGTSRQPTVISSGRNCGADAITPVSNFPGGVTWNPPKTALVNPGTRVGYRFNSQGTVLATRTWNVRNQRAVDASARAIPPGKGQRWAYLTSGPFAGWWIKIGNGVSIVP